MRYVPIFAIGVFGYFLLFCAIGWMGTIGVGLVVLAACVRLAEEMELPK